MVMFQNVLMTIIVCDEHEQVQFNPLRRHTLRRNASLSKPLIHVAVG
jgi:hypothetical protein